MEYYTVFIDATIKDLGPHSPVVVGHSKQGL